MNRRELVPFGRRVYPSPTARRGERMGQTPFRYCIQCGFPNDTRTTAWAQGANEGDGGLSLNDGSDPAEWTASAGCAFCGSMKWLPSKPTALPDDERLPTRRSRRIKDTA